MSNNYIFCIFLIVLGASAGVFFNNYLSQEPGYDKNDLQTMVCIEAASIDEGMSIKPLKAEKIWLGGNYEARKVNVILSYYVQTELGSSGDASVTCNFSETDNPRFHTPANLIGYQRADGAKYDSKSKNALKVLILERLKISQE